MALVNSDVSGHYVLRTNLQFGNQVSGSPFCASRNGKRQFRQTHAGNWDPQRIPRPTEAYGSGSLPMWERRFKIRPTPWAYANGSRDGRGVAHTGSQRREIQRGGGILAGAGHPGPSSEVPSRRCGRGSRRAGRSLTGREKGFPIRPEGCILGRGRRPFPDSSNPIPRPRFQRLRPVV
jgi:hypothetical protein